MDACCSAGVEKRRSVLSACRGQNPSPDPILKRREVKATARPRGELYRYMNVPVLLWTRDAFGEQASIWEEKRDQELFLKRLRDFEKGGKRQTEREIEIEVACRLKLEVKYLRCSGQTHTCTHTRTHTHHLTMSQRVCEGETSLIQLCPVAHQSYVCAPSLSLFLSKSMSVRV